MQITLPHELGDSLTSPKEGQEICVRIDGTVNTNGAGELVLDVTDVSVENYDEEDMEEDEEEGYSKNESDSGESKHAIVIGIMKKPRM